MPLYSPENLERVVIELTANCNAMCPACDRWNKGRGGINSIVEQHLGSKGHMDLRKFNNAIPNELFSNYKNFGTIEFNGSVGDAILHPQFIQFIRLVNRKNDHYRDGENRVRMRLATNAGVHGENFWKEVGKQFALSHRNNMIIVALDGTNNQTHQQDRRGVDFDKALKNAITAINTGARVRWQFIEFKHNKHQIEDAIAMAKKYGFHDIEIRNTRGENAVYGDWIHQMIKQEKPAKVETQRSLTYSASVEYKQKVRVEKKLKNKLLTKIQYKETDKIKNIKKSVEQIKDSKNLLDNIPIVCQWGNSGSVNIEFNGIVHPCCHMNQGLFYPNMEKNKFYHNVNNLYDKNWNSLDHQNLIEILKHPYFNKDLEQSFKPDTDTDKKFKRLPVCLETCSKQKNDDSDDLKILR